MARAPGISTPASGNQPQPEAMCWRGAADYALGGACQEVPTTMPDFATVAGRCPKTWPPTTFRTA
eukprot:12889771-Prorocentrum_lima.AAC.1